MPQYRLTAPTFINNALRPIGEVVEWDGKPGSTLEPVDDEAKARKNGVPPAPVVVKAERLPRELVPIPEDWRELRPERRINLARRLGAPAKGTGAEAADQVIETELAHRATV